MADEVPIAEMPSPAPGTTAAKNSPKKVAKPVAKKKSAAGKKPSSPGKKDSGAAKSKKRKVIPSPIKTKPNPKNSGFEAFVAEYNKIKGKVSLGGERLEKAGGFQYVLGQTWLQMPMDKRMLYERSGRAKALDGLAKDAFVEQGEKIAAKADKAVIKAGGGVEYVLKEVWEGQGLSPEVRQLYFEAAQCKAIEAKAFQTFWDERKSAVKKIDPEVISLGGGEKVVMEKMWNDLSKSQRQLFENAAASTPFNPSVSVSHRKPKQMAAHLVPLSEKSKSTTEIYQKAAYDAINTIGSKHGSTAKEILAWLEKERPDTCEREVLEQALVRGLRSKKIEKDLAKIMQTHYKTTVLFKKKLADDAKREQEMLKRLHKTQQEKERREQLEKDRLAKMRRDQEEERLKGFKKDTEAGDKLRKKRIRTRNYPIEDLQALSEAVLCDSDTMQFSAVAQKRKADLEQLEADQVQLQRQKESWKDKFTEGMRVEMLLEDDHGRENWEGGHVIAVLENGLDIAFDDGDFQENVPYNDPELQIPKTDKELEREAATLMMQKSKFVVAELPPPLDNSDVPAEVLAELLSVSSLLTRFAEDADVPEVSLSDLASVVRNSREDRVPGSPIWTIRNNLHVKLLQLIVDGEDETEFLYVDLDRDMIDELTWQEVLPRFIRANVFDYECTREILSIGTKLYAKSYDQLSWVERTNLLSYLCCELLASDEIRDVLDEDADKHVELIQNFQESERKLKLKHADKAKQEREGLKEERDAKKKEKEEEEAKKRAEREEQLKEKQAEFVAWLEKNQKNVPPMDPKDAKYKELWQKWKKALQAEKQAEKAAAGAVARQEERDRLKAEATAAKEAEKRKLQEERDAEKARRAEEKAAAARAKEGARQAAAALKASKKAGKQGNITAADFEPTLSRSEQLKKLREEREGKLREEREKEDAENAVKEAAAFAGRKKLLDARNKELAEEAADEAKGKEKDKRMALARKEWARHNKEYNKTGAAAKAKEKKRLRNKVAELDEELAKYELKLEPLGRDRFHNRYWWTRANADRVYVEKVSRDLLPAFPPLVSAWMDCGGDAEGKHMAVQAELSQRLRAKPEQLAKQLQVLDIEPIADVDGLLKTDLFGVEPYVVQFANTGKVVLPRKPNEGLGRPKKTQSENLLDDLADVKEFKQEEPTEDVAPPESSDEDRDQDEETDMVWQADEEWSYYDTPEQIERLVETLNPLGARESQLKQELERRMEAIADAMTAKQRQRKRGGVAKGAQPEDAAYILANLLLTLQKEYMEKDAMAAAVAAKWVKVVKACSSWRDFIDPMVELGETFAKVAGLDVEPEAEEESEEDDEDEDEDEESEDEREEEDGEWKQGAVVWAKVKYAPWWPAKVDVNEDAGSISKGNKYNVVFFDTGQWCWAAVDDIRDFNEGLTELRDQKIKKSQKESFEAAVTEALSSERAGKESKSKGKTPKKGKGKSPKKGKKNEDAGGEKKGEDEVEETEDGGEEEEEEDLEPTPQSWEGWVKQWRSFVTDYGGLQREAAMVFAAYAMRSRVETKLEQLVKGKGGRSKKRAPAASPHKKGRGKKGGRGGRVDYVEESSSEESEESEEEEYDEDDLFAAAQTGDRKLLRKVLDAEVEINTLNQNEEHEGKTALMHACELQHKNCVKMLLDRKADANVVDNDGWTAVMFAAKADDADCVNLVCKAGARLENTCKEFGATAFLLACENGCSKSLTALINKGCSMAAKDNDGSSGWQLARNEDPPHNEVLAILDRESDEKNPRKGSGRGEAGGGRARKQTTRMVDEVPSSDDEAPRGRRGKRRGRDESSEEDDAEDGWEEGDYNPRGRGRKRRR